MKNKKNESAQNESLNQDKTAEIEGVNEQSSSDKTGEFKITVRKLEMPVRPRGVLAE